MGLANLGPELSFFGDFRYSFLLLDAISGARFQQARPALATGRSAAVSWSWTATLATGDELSFYTFCHWLPFLGDSHSDLAAIAVIFSQTMTVSPAAR
jgi:hypothetical protein